MREVVLVTGGAGFIGSHVCEILLDLNYRVILLDKFQHNKNKKRKQLNINKIRDHPSLTIVDSNVNNKKKLTQVFRKYNISYIFHFAGNPNVPDSLTHPLQTVKNNLFGITLLFEYAVAYKVKHIVFTSSSLVYGATSKLPMIEDDPCFYPTSPYAATLRASELMAYTFYHLFQIPITSLRLFPVIGPRMRQNLFLPIIIRLISERRSITIYGNGLTSRSYIYIDDVVKGIVASMKKPHGYQIINLGGEKPLSLLDLVKIVEGILKTRAKITFQPQRKEEIIHVYPDIEKAKKILGFTPKISIEEGIHRYINWYKSATDLN